MITPKITVAELNTAVGYAVSHRRVALGISQAQLAQWSDLTQSAISDIENGTRSITLFTFMRLSMGLGMAPDEFMDWILDAIGKQGPLPRISQRGRPHKRGNE